MDAMLKNLFEEQFIRFRNQKENPIEPYDVAGWTLPILWALSISQLKNTFEINVTPLTDAITRKEVLNPQFKILYSFWIKRKFTIIKRLEGDVRYFGDQRKILE
jgi:hypothetical protein